MSREPQAYARGLVRVASQYLNGLHGHHNIEDHHYFPMLKALDARIASGFDLLDADHQAMDGAIHELAEATNAVLLAVREAAPAEAAAEVLRLRLGGVRADARPASDRRGGTGRAGDPRQSGGGNLNRGVPQVTGCPLPRA